MNHSHTDRWPVAWSAVLAATTLSGTLVIGCMMPFAAIATIAALVLPRRIGPGAVAACWLGNQALGFGMLGYPWDGPTFGAGLSLLGASLLAWVAAGAAAAAAAAAAAQRGGGGGRGRAGTAALLAFAAAFAAYEGALFAYALVFGDAAMFTPQIIGLIALNDTLWFAGLWLGWQVLRRVVPGAAVQAAA